MRKIYIIKVSNKPVEIDLVQSEDKHIESKCQTKPIEINLVESQENLEKKKVNKLLCCKNT